MPQPGPSSAAAPLMRLPDTFPLPLWVINPVTRRDLSLLRDGPAGPRSPEQSRVASARFRPNAKGQQLDVGSDRTTNWVGYSSGDRELQPREVRLKVEKQSASLATARRTRGAAIPPRHGYLDLDGAARYGNGNQDRARGNLHFAPGYRTVQMPLFTRSDGGRYSPYSLGGGLACLVSPTVWARSSPARQVAPNANGAPGPAHSVSATRTFKGSERSGASQRCRAATAPIPRSAPPMPIKPSHIRELIRNGIPAPPALSTERLIGMHLQYCKTR